MSPQKIQNDENCDQENANSASGDRNAQTELLDSAKSGQAGPPSPSLRKPEIDSSSNLDTKDHSPKFKLVFFIGVFLLIAVNVVLAVFISRGILFALFLPFNIIFVTCLARFFLRLIVFPYSARIVQVSLEK